MDFHLYEAVCKKGVLWQSPNTGEWIDLVGGMLGEKLRNAVLFDATDLFDVWDDDGKIHPAEIVRDVPSQRFAVPYPVCWINVLKTKRLGAWLVIKADPESIGVIDPENAYERWYHVFLLEPCSKNQPYATCVWFLGLDKNGRLAFTHDGKVHCIGRPCLQWIDAVGYQEAEGLLLTWNLFFLTFLWYPTIKDVVWADDDRLKPRQERQLRKLRDGRKVIVKTLVVREGGTQIRLAEALHGKSKHDKRWHTVRSHIKTYTKEAPMFGWYVGPVLVPAHHRGNKDKGVVLKDYKWKRK